MTEPLTPEQIGCVQAVAQMRLAISEKGEVETPPSMPREMLAALCDSHELLRARLAAAEQARQQAEQERDALKKTPTGEETQ